MRTLFNKKPPSVKQASDSDSNTEPSSFINDSIYDENSSRAPTPPIQKQESESTTYESPPLPPSVDPNELVNGPFKCHPSISDLFLSGNPELVPETDNEEDSEEDKGCCCLGRFF
jgi:hypothetical protein